MNLTFTCKYLADEPEQVATCAKWAFDAWGKYNPTVTQDMRAERFREHCNKDKIPLTIICKVDSQIAGMASLRANDGIGEELSPWLGSLYVAEKFRRSGIGAKLIARIEREACKLGFQNLYLLTYEVTLPYWYSALGWKKTKDDILFGNSIVVMQKPLK